MDRIVLGTAHTLVITFTLDGAPAEPDPVGATVEVLRSDGTIVVSAGTDATDLAGTGVYGHTLEPSETTPRGDLVARWTATLADSEQTLETLAEIVDVEAIAAREKLAAMVEATAAPELTVDELWDLLRDARSADLVGVLPSDVLWEPTWDLNAAAAAGWRRKAGKVAPNYSFSIDNQRSDQGQVHEHCLAQAARYDALVSTYVRIQ